MKLPLRPTKFRVIPSLGAACPLTGSTLSSLSAQTSYTWNGGAGNWSNAALWSTGAAPNAAAADVFIDGGKTGVNSVVTMDGNYGVGRLTLDAGDTLNLNDGVNFYVNNGAFTGSGSLVNNGTVNFNATANYATVLAGAGSLVFIRRRGLWT